MAPVPLNFQQFTSVRDKTNMNDEHERAQLARAGQDRPQAQQQAGQAERQAHTQRQDKINDTLTNLREVLARLSNDEALKYTRQCRLIVAKLRKCWVDLNDEMT